MKTKWIEVTIIVMALGLLSFCFAAWDNTKPADSDALYGWPASIRANWDALEAVMGVDLAYTPLSNYIINIQDAPYSADPTGVADSTSAIQDALTAGQANGQQVYAPAGTYLISQITNFENGSILRGAGMFKTIFKGSDADVTPFYIDGQSLKGLTLSDFTVLGAGAGTGHGIHIYNAGGVALSPYLILLENIYIKDAGGRGLYIPEQFTTRIIGIEVLDAGSNAIEIMGGNTTTLINCFVKQVATGMAAYRIYRSPILISCNGVVHTAGEVANVDWAVCGQSLAEDGVDTYSHPVFLNCNIESFSRYGVRFKANSGGTFIGTRLLSSATTATVALYYDTYPNVLYTPLWDGTSRIEDGGGGWTNNQAIHARGVPFITFGTSTTTDSFYEHTVAQIYSMPTIAWHYASLYAEALSISNIYLPRIEFAVQPFTTLADEATPTVLGHNLFVTGGNTNITDFDDGVTGQIITILCKHTLDFDTTTAQDADHNLDGSSADLNGETGDILTWLCEDGTTWQLSSYIDATDDNN